MALQHWCTHDIFQITLVFAHHLILYLLFEVPRSDFCIGSYLAAIWWFYIERKIQCQISRRHNTKNVTAWKIKHNLNNNKNELMIHGTRVNGLDIILEAQARTSRGHPHAWKHLPYIEGVAISQRDDHESRSVSPPYWHQPPTQSKATCTSMGARIKMNVKSRWALLQLRGEDDHRNVAQPTKHSHHRVHDLAIQRRGMMIQRAEINLAKVR